jgi:epoxide hydrolase
MSDVISMIGYTFSSLPRTSIDKPVPFAFKDVIELIDTLMDTLGYTKYIAQGGDWGSLIVRYFATFKPEKCRAIRK